MLALLTDSPGRSAAPSANSATAKARTPPWLEASVDAARNSSAADVVDENPRRGWMLRRRAASATTSPAAKLTVAAVCATVSESDVTETVYGYRGLISAESVTSERSRSPRVRPGRARDVNAGGPLTQRRQPPEGDGSQV